MQIRAVEKLLVKRDQGGVKGGNKATVILCFRIAFTAILTKLRNKGAISVPLNITFSAFATIMYMQCNQTSRVNALFY